MEIEDLILELRKIAGQYSAEERSEEISDMYDRLIKAGNSYQISASNASSLVDFDAKREAEKLRRNLYD